MKKFQVFLSGILATLTAIWPFISTPYLALVIALGWTSLLIFPFFYGLVAWLLVSLYKGVDMSIDKYIEEKIKGRRLKGFLISLFKKSRLIALCAAAFWLCPLIAPVLAKLCIKNDRNALIAAVSLNIITTSIWICIYLGGAEAVKTMLGI